MRVKKEFMFYCQTDLRKLVGVSLCSIINCGTLENPLIWARHALKCTKKPWKTLKFGYLRMRPRFWFSNRENWVLWGPRDPNLPPEQIGQAKNSTFRCYHTWSVTGKNTVPSNIFWNEWNNDESGFDDRICSEVSQKNTRFLHFLFSEKIFKVARPNCVLY